MKENFVKKVRERKGISQVELAKKSSIPYQNIGKIEKNQIGLGPKRLKKIAKALKVDEEELRTGIPTELIRKREQKRIETAMSYALELYEDSHEFISLNNKEKRSKIVNIAGIANEMLIEVENLEEKEDKDNYVKRLKYKHVSGLAANCVINIIKNGID